MRPIGYFLTKRFLQISGWILLVVTGAGTMLSQPQPAQQLTAPARESVLRSHNMPLADFDSRLAMNPDASNRAARADALRQNLGASARIIVDARTGRIRQAFRTNGFLTGPMGTGSGALSSFLMQNAEAYSLSAADIQEFAKKSEGVDSQTGVTTSRYSSRLGALRFSKASSRGM